MTSDTVVLERAMMLLVSARVTIVIITNAHIMNSCITLSVVLVAPTFLSIVVVTIVSSIPLTQLPSRVCVRHGATRISHVIK